MFSLYYQKRRITKTFESITTALWIMDTQYIERGELVILEDSETGEVIKTKYRPLPGEVDGL